MALMLYLDDAMKVLLQNGYIEDGYIDEDGGSEIVRNELEQKCYLREPVDIVLCKDCVHRGDKHKCILAYVADKHDFPYFFYDNHGEWFCADGKRKEGR